ncbi:unnamed protein product, partial [Ectocarpus sp. 13 AM-2016]
MFKHPATSLACVPCDNYRNRTTHMAEHAWKSRNAEDCTRNHTPGPIRYAQFSTKMMPQQSNDGFWFSLLLDEAVSAPQCAAPSQVLEYFVWFLLQNNRDVKIGRAVCYLMQPTGVGIKNSRVHALHGVDQIQDWLTRMTRLTKC